MVIEYCTLLTVQHDKKKINNTLEQPYIDTYNLTKYDTISKYISEPPYNIASVVYTIYVINGKKIFRLVC